MTVGTKNTANAYNTRDYNILYISPWTIQNEWWLNNETTLKFQEAMRLAGSNKECRWLPADRRHSLWEPIGRMPVNEDCAAIRVCTSMRTEISKKCKFGCFLKPAMVKKEPRKKLFNMRVWSWLRMNAGGVLNTCKSNGTFHPKREEACFGLIQPECLVADGWVTRG